MARFVLVHGAGHAGWCWERVVERLRGLGHEAVAPDLPARGDGTPAAEATMDGYVDAVRRVLEESSGKSVLVAHSMGGLAATGAAEAAPGKVARLVYVTAYAPLDGDSVGSILAADPGSQVPAVTELVDGVAVQIADASVIPIFYNDCSSADAAYAKSRLVPEPAAPFGATLTLTEQGWGTVPRYYIGCSRDQCIAIAYQRVLAERSGSHWEGEIDSGHSPFINKPDQLVEMLVKLAV